MSAQLTFAITNQIIKRTDHFRPAALSQNYLRAGFTFSEDWDDDADKIAIFTTQCGRSYEVILDENDECGVPWEVLTSPGYFFVSAYSGDRITATKASVYIEDTGYVEDPTATSDPSIDIYTQLQELIEERTSEEGIGAIVLQYLEDHPPEAPVQSVNGKTGVVVLDAEDVGALPDDTVIPDDSTVAEWGYTKNTGTYSKPVDGIPSTDLDADVQASLGKADTALQSHQDISGLQTKAITDTGGYYTTDTVEGALQEIGAEIAGVNALIGTGVIA